MSPSEARGGAWGRGSLGSEELWAHEGVWIHGDDFRAYMERFGWSSSQLAARVRASERTVKRWRADGIREGTATRAVQWATANTPPAERSREGAGQAPLEEKLDARVARRRGIFRKTRIRRRPRSGGDPAL